MKSTASLDHDSVVTNVTVSLNKKRSAPDSFGKKLKELWNDPRPVTTSLSLNSDDVNDSNKIAYCIVSDVFDVALPDSNMNEVAHFQVLLYPRGRFDGSRNDNILSNPPAAAYLRYIPHEYGDEVDIAWRMKLIDTHSREYLKICTSGGLPKSPDTWSAAMTFCSEMEALESVGRASDWGSTIWDSRSVCNALSESSLQAQIQISVFGSRKGENSLLLGGAYRAVKEALEESKKAVRSFRAGEVIVPLHTEVARDGAMSSQEQEQLNELKNFYIFPGIDYRIMTLRDAEDRDIFSTSSLSKPSEAKIALRPCGWKSQQQRLWLKRGGQVMNDWPVEVPASFLTGNNHTICVTRFNAQSALPRIVSAFSRDPVIMSAAVLLAFLPIPIAFLVRNLISFYVIPTASMEPTLLKGDVLIVEKFPNVINRAKRGDIVLFSPPSTLREIVRQSGSSAIGSNSLFVKRLVGMPGDQNVLMDPSTNQVTINHSPAIGPDRTLCNDNNEPLKLIDRLLVNGKGIKVPQLAPDEVYVLGDCKSVSIDSRVFGPLPLKNVVGKPIARLWPLNRLANGKNL